MKEIDRQLRRLLRAAARARSRTWETPACAPSATVLLRSRDEAPAPVIAAAVRPVLQGALAAIAVLVVAVTVVNLQVVERANQDVFAVSEAVLTRLLTP